MTGLDGRTAIVTGAASGIGAAAAVELARRGVHLTLVDVDGPGVKRIEGVIRGSGGAATSVTCDVAGDECPAAVESAVRAWGTVDVLVNAAGVFDHNCPAEELTRAIWDRVMGVNARGTAFMTAAALPVMLAQQSGAVVNISSIASEVGHGGGVTYAASKGAITSFTRQVACEVADRGVRVNAVAPGAIDTNLFATSTRELGPDEPAGSRAALFKQQMLDGTLPHTPLGRLGHPDDVATAVSFLASDAAAFITGQVLVVDGGYTRV